MNKTLKKALAVITAGAVAVGVLTFANPSEIDQTGTLEYAHSDDFINPPVDYYWLKKANGEKIVLNVKNPKVKEKLNITGIEVKVRGQQVKAEGGEPVIDVSNSEILSPVVATAPSIKNIAVLALNWQDNPIQQLTLDQINNILFVAPNSAKKFFEQESRGSVTFTGQVFGYYTVASPYVGCDWSTYGSQARTAATNAGVDLTQFTNIVYIMPGNSYCAWSGLAYVGGRDSWINSSSSTATYSGTIDHELGHNFILQHASALNCFDTLNVRVSLSNNCTYQEYGDPYAIMGSGTGPTHNHAHMISQEGWLQPGEILDVTKTGVYEITTILGTPPGTPKLLRIPHNSENDIYIDYRVDYTGGGWNFDKFLACCTKPGVVLHLDSKFLYRNTMLIDTVPVTATFQDSPLLVGQTLVDPISNIRITTLSTGTNSATIKVDFPSVVVTPSPIITLPPTPTPSVNITPPPTPTPSPTATVTPTITPIPTITPTPSPGSVAFNQFLGSATVSKSGNTALTLPILSTVPVGSKIVVAVTNGTFAGGVGCQDNKGNTYTVDMRNAARNLFVCSSNIAFEMLPGDVITATYPGFSGVSLMSASSFKGVTTVDKTSSGTSTSTKVVSVPSLITTGSPDLIVGVVLNKTFTPSIFKTASSFSGLTVVYQIGTGTYNTLGSVTTGAWSAVGIAYK